MSQKRFSRLSNSFTKRLTNQVAAVGLFVARYNLFRVHETLRVISAIQVGATNRIWTIGELIGAATTGW